MTLIAFDCDGTLACSGGPIDVERLHMLREGGALVIIVSPSPACKELGFLVLQHPSLDRLETLRTAAGLAPRDVDLRIYVSDNPGDGERARLAGFTYVHPKDFGGGI